MTFYRKLALAYGLILLAAASLNYIPGVTDPGGLAFGLFQLDPFDDALHVVSAIWAFAAAALSSRATKVFLLLFGAAYLSDGVLGIFTGWGYLDFAIFTNESLGMDLSVRRLLVNLPHIGLGLGALVAGVFAPSGR